VGEFDVVLCAADWFFIKKIWFLESERILRVHDPEVVLVTEISDEIDLLSFRHGK
jgi:hypothetical protein